MIDLDDHARRYVDQLAIEPAPDLDAVVRARRGRRRRRSMAAAAVLVVILAGGARWTTPGARSDEVATSAQDADTDATAEPTSLRCEDNEGDNVPYPDPTSLPEGLDLRLQSLRRGAQRQFHYRAMRDGVNAAIVIAVYDGVSEPDPVPVEPVELPGAEPDRSGWIYRGATDGYVRWAVNEDWGITITMDGDGGPAGVDTLMKEFDDAFIIDLASRMRLDLGPLAGEETPSMWALPAADAAVVAEGEVDGRPWRIFEGLSEPNVPDGVAMDEPAIASSPYPGGQSVVPPGTQLFIELDGTIAHQMSWPYLGPHPGVGLVTHDGRGVALVTSPVAPALVAAVDADGKRTPYETITLAEGERTLAVVPLTATTDIASIVVVNPDGLETSFAIAPAPCTGWTRDNPIGAAQ